MYMAIRGGIFSVFCMLALYHILIFIGRKDEPSNIIYGLYCICLAGIVLIRNIYPHITPQTNFFIYNILFIIILYLTFSLLILLSYNVFELYQNINKNIIITIHTLFTIISFISSIGLWSTKNDIFKNMFFLSLSLYCVACLATIFYKTIKYKKKKHIIMITGFSTLIITVSFASILTILKIKLYLHFVYPGLLAHSFIFTFFLTDLFNKEHRTLLELKNTLEQKVEDRTKKLQLANKEIQETNQKQTDFFINLAHETRTPLQLILISLENYIDKTEKTEELETIEKNFKKLLNDMVNFLDINKLKKGKFFYNHNKIINLYENMKIKIKLFNPLAAKKNIKINLDTKIKHAHTKIDSFAIDRIINNILDNAIKYTPQNGIINVSLKSSSDNKIKLIVQDNGIGISKEQLNHIFDPYHQAFHKKKSYQGLGMGLAIVKNILEQVKGNIDVKSKLKKGTTFTITLRRTSLKAEKTEPQKRLTYPQQCINTNLPTESKYNPKKSTLFIVDDNIELIKALQKTLDYEYNIYYALNGKEALNKIKKTPPPNIILSDIMMPVMDGYKMQEKLNKNPEYASIYFIFLTAKTEAEDRLKALSLGAVDFISKPVDIEELKAKLHSIIKRQKSEKKAEEAKGAKKITALYKKYNVTPKESQILKLLKTGLEYRQIADELGISLNTVHTHIKKLFKKCVVTNKTELLNIFLKK